MAQLVKNPPAMRETWVGSLGWEDPWRRERLPTPVFWPRESHGLYSPWGRKELDTTEQLALHFTSLHTYTHLSVFFLPIYLGISFFHRELFNHQKILTY